MYHNNNIIFIENLDDKTGKAFKEILEMLPKSQRKDIGLQRLIAFRLNLDGEGPTREYLNKKITLKAQCGYAGSLYNFLKDDLEEKNCGIKSPGHRMK